MHSSVTTKSKTRTPRHKSASTTSPAPRVAASPATLSGLAQAKLRAGSPLEATTSTPDFRASCGEGRPLPPEARREAEARLGPLGPVQLHTDSRAQALGRSLGADAVTLGRDVAIARPDWNPATGVGAHLLLHELTHVKQAGDAPLPPGGTIPIDRADSAAERGAWRAEQGPAAQRASVAPAAAALRCRRVDLFGLGWEVEHSDVGSGTISSEIAGLVATLTGVTAAVAATTGAALERTAGGRSDLLLRALDFLRDNRGILPRGMDVALTEGAARFCAGRTDTATALPDAFYRDLLIALLYTGGAGDLQIHHKSGSVFPVPGLAAGTADFGATDSPTTSLQRPAPPRAGGPISGGFPKPLSLTVGFATGARFPNAGEVDSLVRAAGSQIDAGLLPALREVAQDQYVLRALRTFLVTDRGTLVALSSDSGKYTDTSPPKIEVGTAGGPLDTRSTLVHELMHYVFDKSDSILAEAKNTGGADHPAIAAVETKFIIIDQIRHGQPPLHAKIEESFGRFLNGKDFFTTMESAIAANDSAALSAAVNGPDFAPTTVASGLLGEASGLAFVGKAANYQMTPDQMRDLAFIWAQNAAIVRRAMNEAIAVARRESISLSAAFGRPSWQASMSQFLRSFVKELQRDPRQGVLALEKRL